MALTERAEQISEFYSRVVDNSHTWNDGFLTFGEWKTKSGDPIPHPLCYEAAYDEPLEGNMIQADHSVLDVACGQGPGMLQIKSQTARSIQGLDISAANVK